MKNKSSLLLIALGVTKRDKEIFDRMDEILIELLGGKNEKGIDKNWNSRF